MESTNSAPALLENPRSATLKRQRKWHPRGFTGCLNCRQRHVKCDEQTPSCANCTRLHKKCAFSLTFVPLSVNNPSSGHSKDSAISLKRRHTEPVIEADEEAADDTGNYFQWHPTSSDQLALQLPLDRQIVPASRSRDSPPLFQLYLPAQFQSQNDMYYQHYLMTVSTLLIIFDTTSDSNPYRTLLGHVGSEHSDILQGTMEALGAMHLSQLPQAQNRSHHRKAAVSMYTHIVTQLRRALAAEAAQPASLELFAVCLLLCMFEQMSATDASWKAHLRGAASILRSMYSPGPATADQNAGTSLTLSSESLPIRRFLVSLLSYLDVAASCATGEEPLLPGDYWESLGGGWQYNLGVPDSTTELDTEKRILAQVRSAWSRVMSIQTEIGIFAKLRRTGLCPLQRDTMYNDLVQRLRNWHDSVPDAFLQLVNLDGIPEGASDDQVKTLTITSCVQSYALACDVYLERAATRRNRSADPNDAIHSVVDRILTLALNFSRGLNQLAVVWPILTAGIATIDPDKQDRCRMKLNGMRCFGFKAGSHVIVKFGPITDRIC
ncbi:Zn(2)-C6 fungal-type DNA-binding domain protein [Cordyceps fumosorosea ARSEF 2679]|uniref:Zn(2)-C6 fungal-type DNA-binding domain protein n=1 Tax=Cordyceps fumosorosea (strain ARSEF 2679) TaxID=1081104 RepID=A0A167N5Y5_CORFA|nr:Zn(2)-C6 fungal-type DNA-binding domain protein [Cordyceps fumosorosea ARSEF 2679]OAA55167.1 Zn(2)-C6 fungal-type DNA-binding domain protein [Cordyceps fumosorosea ARSEF 2679]